MNTPNANIVFTEPGKVELREAAMPVPSEGQIVIRTECSILSPGTELACLSGRESWAPLPFVPGYGSIGTVCEVSAGVTKARAGDRILTYGKHSRFALADLIVIPVPDEVQPEHAVFARMAAVSITALRVADIALGDTMAVVGLGLVGNLAAQLFRLAGCRVIGIDLSEKRRALARECGIAHTFAPGEEALQGVRDVTRGKLCRAVVDATGVPAVVQEAAALAGKQGELILLGSPRGGCTTDITPFLNRIHLWGNGCLTVKGAHEWRLPVFEDASGHGRHSIEGNMHCLLHLIATKQLHIAPLLTHVANPRDAQKMYDGLQNEKDAYMGVVFDWRT